MKQEEDRKNYTKSREITLFPLQVGDKKKEAPRERHPKNKMVSQEGREECGGSGENGWKKWNERRSSSNSSSKNFFSFFFS